LHVDITTIQVDGVPRQTDCAILGIMA